MDRKPPAPSPSQRERFSERERVVLAIIRAAGGSFWGKTRLFKAYWIAHLFHWKKRSGLLTRDHGVVHMPEGPGIDAADELFEGLRRKGALKVSTRPKGPFSEIVFTSTADDEIDGDRFLSIAEAVRYVGNKSAAALSEESHEKSWAWRRAQPGEPLDIEIDTLDPVTLRSMQASIEAARESLRDVF